MQDLRLVVCDIAGTTVEDAGQVPDAFATTLAAFGVVVTAERLRSVRGASKRDAIRALLPDGPSHASDTEAAYDRFRELLRRRYRDGGVRPVPGAADIFEWLRSCDVRVALNTGFDRIITDMLLAALGWGDGVVDAVICGDDVPRGRPAPDMILRAMAMTGVASARQVANVGDTVLDLQAGASAGVRWNIGVLSGAHDRAALEAAPHTHLIPSIAALRDLWPALDARARRRTSG